VLDTGVDAEQRPGSHIHADFLECLALGALLGRLTQLQVAARERPLAVRGLDSAAEQQHTPAALGQHVGDEPGVQVMDEAAAVADQPAAALFLQEARHQAGRAVLTEAGLPG
jgi:hypothetical protein